MHHATSSGGTACLHVCAAEELRCFNIWYFRCVWRSKMETTLKCFPQFTHRKVPMRESGLKGMGGRRAWARGGKGRWEEDSQPQTPCWQPITALRPLCITFKSYYSISSCRQPHVFLLWTRWTRWDRELLFLKDVYSTHNDRIGTMFGFLLITYWCQADITRCRHRKGIVAPMETVEQTLWRDYFLSILLRGPALGLRLLECCM